MAPSSKESTAPHRAIQTSVGPLSLKWTRRLDLMYFAFFLTHIPVMFLIDLQPLILPILPFSLPAALLRPRQWYMSTYADRFFVDPPAWFMAFIFMEAVYHVPLSLWAVGVLRKEKEHPLLSMHLLLYAVQTFVTTLACTVDMFGWEDRTDAQKRELAGLYVPYLALSMIMGLDMFTRLQARLAKV